MHDDIHRLKKRCHIGSKSQEMHTSLQPRFLGGAVQFLSIGSIILGEDSFPHHRQMHPGNSAALPEPHAAFPAGQASKIQSERSGKSSLRNELAKITDAQARGFKAVIDDPTTARLPPVATNVSAVAFNQSPALPAAKRTEEVSDSSG
jgi:hypothetical protein